MAFKYFNNPVQVKYFNNPVQVVSPFYKTTEPTPLK